MSKQVSVVLGSYNRLPFLKTTIQSIRTEVQSLKHEIIVVDGGSDDGSLEWLISQKDILTILQHNRGSWNNSPIERRSWGYFMNLAFKCAQGKYICMLSDDCLVIPGAILNGYALFEKEISAGNKVGALAFYWRDWSVQKDYHVGCTLGNKMYVNHGMYLNEALKEVGYIDENTCFFYNGDGDLCLKMWQAGYSCIASPNSFIEHYPHANIDVRKSNYLKYKSDIKNYLKKWEGIFYNPKLNNLGMIIEKEFEDPHKTGELFQNIHQQIIAANPAIIKPKPIYSRLTAKSKIYFKAGIRKIWHFFS